VSRFQLTELAETDLEGIVDYIPEEAGDDRAIAVLTDLISAFTLLGRRPGIGHQRPDLASSELRFWIVHYPFNQGV
jgi:plasmid stabilization system protein ParE